MPQETNTGTSTYQGIYANYKHIPMPFYKLHKVDPSEGVQSITWAMGCVSRVGVGLQPPITLLNWHKLAGDEENLLGTGSRLSWRAVIHLS